MVQRLGSFSSFWPRTPLSTGRLGVDSMDPPLPALHKWASDHRRSGGT